MTSSSVLPRDRPNPADAVNMQGTKVLQFALLVHLTLLPSSQAAISEYVILNARTNKFIRSARSFVVIHTSDPISIVARTPGVDNVTFTSPSRGTDYTVPYSLPPDRPSRDFKPLNLGFGYHRILATSDGRKEIALPAEFFLDDLPQHSNGPHPWDLAPAARRPGVPDLFIPIATQVPVACNLSMSPMVTLREFGFEEQNKPPQPQRSFWYTAKHPCVPTGSLRIRVLNLYTDPQPSRLSLCLQPENDGDPYRYGKELR